MIEEEKQLTCLISEYYLSEEEEIEEDELEDDYTPNISQDLTFATSQAHDSEGEDQLDSDELGEDEIDDDESTHGRSKTEPTPSTHEKQDKTQPKHANDGELSAQDSDAEDESGDELELADLVQIPNHPVPGSRGWVLDINVAPPDWTGPDEWMSLSEGQRRAIYVRYHQSMAFAHQRNLKIILDHLEAAEQRRQTMQDRTGVDEGGVVSDQDPAGVGGEQDSGFQEKPEFEDDSISNVPLQQCNT